MLFTLPNGKTIEITVEQFFDMTDEDIQYLVSINYGSFAASPWAGSEVIHNKKSTIMKEEFLEDEEGARPIDEDFIDDVIIPEDMEGPDSFPEIED